MKELIIDTGNKNNLPQINHREYFYDETYGRKVNEMDSQEWQKILDSDKEIDQILAIIPGHGIDREIRIKQNTEVRERLSIASNYTVIHLTLESRNQLSQKELNRRFEENKININESFCIMQRSMKCIYTKDIGKLLETVDKYIKKEWQSSTMEQKQEICDIYRNTNSIIYNRGFIFEEIDIIGLK